MNIAAFFLALLAIFCFLCDLSPRRAPRRPLLPLGLAFLAAAYIAQLIWTTPHMVQIK